MCVDIYGMPKDYLGTYYAVIMEQISQSIEKDLNIQYTVRWP